MDDASRVAAVIAVVAMVAALVLLPRRSSAVAAAAVAGEPMRRSAIGPEPSVADPPGRRAGAPAVGSAVAFEWRDGRPTRENVAMSELPVADKPGLRERKKAKTRAAIQEHALRLFREQGYAATTVEQIAEAAEVSPSTFFRYFGTKEDVVAYDAWDPVVLEVWRSQPPELGTDRSHATRDEGGLRRHDGRAEGRDDEPRPAALLRARAADRPRSTSSFDPARWSSTSWPRCSAGPADDFELRVFAGAFMGAFIAAMLPAARGSGGDFVTLANRALDFVEKGMPL